MYQRYQLVIQLMHTTLQSRNKRHINLLEGNATPAAVILETVKTEGDYGALPSAKLYTLICHINYLQVT